MRECVSSDDISIEFEMFIIYTKVKNNNTMKNLQDFVITITKCIIFIVTIIIIIRL